MADETPQGNAQPEPTRATPPAEQTVTTSVFEPGPPPVTNQPTPGETGDQPAQPASFTQEQVDRILRERLTQERKKYADYDTLKAKVEEQENASKTEAERTAERVQQLEAQNQQLATERRELSIKAAITDAAAAVGLPADAAYRLIDREQVQLAESGAVENAAELVKAIAEAYPGLIRSGGAAQPRVTPANPARGNPESQGRTDGQRFREYFAGGGSSFWGGGGVRQPENS